VVFPEILLQQRMEVFATGKVSRSAITEIN
jgi:hypothetical protein